VVATDPATDHLFLHTKRNAMLQQYRYERFEVSWKLKFARMVAYRLLRFISDG